MIIYLAHPTSGAGLPAAWGDAGRNAERVARLAVGVHALTGGATVRCAPPGSSPAVRYRLVAGDDPLPPVGPRGNPLAALHLPPVDRVWIVGPEDVSVEGDVRAARQAGIIVVPILADQQATFLAAACSVEARRNEAMVVRAVAAALAEEDRTVDLRGPRAVVAAFFASESWVLGGGSLDYEKAAARTGGSTGGVAFRGAVETQALRMVRARRVLGHADVSLVALEALRLREARGCSYRQVALGLGWEDTEQAEERARGICRRAIGAVGRALRAEQREEASA